ncbi:MULTISPECIES: hypothetical protein [unclassified Nostoc]|uniref:hypothetical protein n=1 Tax=unclassified Nostoc TaxID=2593658 RepID=UPI0025D40C1E|nr:hypothetical protein [Nostoc sp. JL33]MBN3870000.1 hypothetical protein [Nostoc sp. JL33]
MRNSKPLRQLMYIKYKRTHPKLQQEIYSIFELSITKAIKDAIAYNALSGNGIPPTVGDRQKK